MCDSYHAPHGAFHTNFKSSFSKAVQENLTGHCSFFVETDAVYSLSFDWELINGQYKLTNVCWQEEGNNYHTVCRSQKDEYALYNMARDTFVSDVYLHDKYDDGADGLLTNRLYTLFTDYPHLHLYSCILL
jgi:hypothetical protein